MIGLPFQTFKDDTVNGRKYKKFYMGLIKGSKMDDSVQT